MTVQDTEAHVPDVYEEVLGIVPITTLGPHNYCVILDPVGLDGKNQLGQKRVVKVKASSSPGRLDALEGCEALGPLPSLLPPQVPFLEASSLFWLPWCTCTPSSVFRDTCPMDLPVSPNLRLHGVSAAGPSWGPSVPAILETLPLSCTKQTSWFVLLPTCCLTLPLTRHWPARDWQGSAARLQTTDILGFGSGVLLLQSLNRVPGAKAQTACKGKSVSASL